MSLLRVMPDPMLDRSYINTSDCVVITRSFIKKGEGRPTRVRHQALLLPFLEIDAHLRRERGHAPSRPSPEARELPAVPIALLASEPRATALRILCLAQQYSDHHASYASSRSLKPTS